MAGYEKVTPTSYVIEPVEMGSAFAKNTKSNATSASTPALKVTDRTGDKKVGENVEEDFYKKMHGVKVSKTEDDFMNKYKLKAKTVDVDDRMATSSGEKSFFRKFEGAPISKDKPVDKEQLLSKYRIEKPAEKIEKITPTDGKSGEKSFLAKFSGEAPKKKTEDDSLLSKYQISTPKEEPKQEPKSLQSSSGEKSFMKKFGGEQPKKKEDESLLNKYKADPPKQEKKPDPMSKYKIEVTPPAAEKKATPTEKPAVAHGEGKTSTKSFFRTFAEQEAAPANNNNEDLLAKYRSTEKIQAEPAKKELKPVQTAPALGGFGGTGSSSSTSFFRKFSDGTDSPKPRAEESVLNKYKIGSGPPPKQDDALSAAEFRRKQQEAKRSQEQSYLSKYKV
eukprot:TRINITY_DN8295_c0_g1_i1.p1 TRINITY_DN8295_c0_g1~~TRINITY_DN8295_c0_g1_i1.p1  ORF type:complete len:391 (+),score=112.17 TRINITY_DN8295_c0_g1_i1:25-1197(+)